MEVVNSRDKRLHQLSELSVWGCLDSVTEGYKIGKHWSLHCILGFSKLQALLYLLLGS